jgi:hypothetical protein
MNKPKLIRPTTAQQKCILCLISSIFILTIMTTNAFSQEQKRTILPFPGPGPVKLLPVRFAALGDTPYSVTSEAELLATFPNIKANNMPFILHIGDIWGGGMPCTDANYISRKNIFTQSNLPFVLVPGDNEYTDCSEPNDSPQVSHTVALDRFRTHLLKNPNGTIADIVIGGQSIQRQSNRIENVRWKYRNVQFIGLNYPGGSTSDMTDAQFDALMNDGIFYWDNTFATMSQSTQAVVVFIQAKPRFLSSASSNKDISRNNFYTALQNKITAFNKPVLLIHGDSHSLDFDQPFTNTNGTTINNWWRLQLIFPSTDWAEIEFIPGSACLPFMLRNHIAAEIDSNDHKISTSAPQAQEQFGSSVLLADFNGDGFDDIVAAKPGINNDTGGISINFSSNEYYGLIYRPGSSNPANDLVQQATFIGPIRLGGFPETGDLFGQALASGDFNNDGFQDLVIGSPGEAVGSLPKSGMINVLWGSAFVNGFEGFDDTANYFQGISWVEGTGVNGDLFGQTLSTGDYNADGYDDLVVGIPGFLQAAGALQVFWGASNRFVNSAPLYHQNKNGIGGFPEANDGFAKSLASGDFNNDGYTDLAIGSPGEGLGAQPLGGIVTVLWGGFLAFSSSTILHQDVAWVAGVSENGDRFGAALTVGDFNGDNYDDLIVGVPGEAPGAAPQGGSIQVFWGSANQFVQSAALISQNSPGIGGGVETGDNFGEVLSTGDFNNDGYDDLVIGVPNEAIGTTVNSGAFNLMIGGSSGLKGGTLYYQGNNTIPGSIAANSLFTGSLATGDINNDGKDDLIVGLPGKNNATGSIILLHGTALIKPK